MIRAIVAVAVSALLALALGLTAIYFSSRSDAVLDSVRLQRIAEQTQQQAASPSDSVSFDSPGTGAQQEDVPAAGDNERKRFKERVLAGLSRWFVFGMVAELVLAAIFAAIVLGQSKTADRAERFRGARPHWYMLAILLAVLITAHSWFMLGASDAAALVASNARGVLIALLALLAGGAFILGTLFAVPVKMLPSVPVGRVLRRKEEHRK